MSTAASDGPGNPLLDASPQGWERLVESLGPATMLVCIESRMGARLRKTCSAEDIWQETLLSVWRDRSAVKWRGPSAFRRWVLAVAENRIRNAADRLAAGKRGAGAATVRLSEEQPSASDAPPLIASTTPSRVATLREHAAAMRAALDRLPDDLREVVRLRVFEELAVVEIASQLQLGESAVKHRLRRGAQLYQGHLRAVLGDSRE
jgi:RNA polymerase sigma factor (sigma-70 family)